MRYLLAIAFLLLASSFGLAQMSTTAYKLQEFDSPGIGCDPFFRLVYFLEELQKQSGSKGLIVIYAGDKGARFGNITGYVKGAKKYVDWYLAVDDNFAGWSKDRVSVLAAEGKTLFAQEFWIIPRDAAMPDLKPASLRWEELTGQYYYSTGCFECDGDYVSLKAGQPNLEEYVGILRSNPAYLGLVTVYTSNDVRRVRDELTGKNKLPRNRYRIKVLKANPKAEYPQLGVDFYIRAGNMLTAFK